MPLIPDKQMDILRKVRKYQNFYECMQKCGFNPEVEGQIQDFQAMFEKSSMYFKFYGNTFDASTTIKLTEYANSIVDAKNEDERRYLTTQIIAITALFFSLLAIFVSVYTQYACFR